MSEVQSGGSVPPEWRAQYKQQFTESVTLFQESLAAFKNSQLPQQKEKFKDVMKQALTIMNETSKDVLAHQRTAQLKADYDNFTKQTNDDNYHKLQTDLEQIKRSL